MKYLQILTHMPKTVKWLSFKYFGSLLENVKH